jgi:hypothetical protein
MIDRLVGRGEIIDVGEAIGEKSERRAITEDVKIRVRK